MITVGNELKKIRKLYGLSQQEMSAGVITKTYYSLVERNMRELNIDDLLKILEINGISVYEFFSVFDEKEMQRRNFRNRVQMAYLTGDVAEIDNLLALLDITRLQRLQLQLVKAEISGG